MAQKDRISLPAYLSAKASTATFNGPWVHIDGIDNVTFQAKWASGVHGVFGFDVSNDGPLTDSQTATPTGTLGASALTLPASMTVAGATPSGSTAGSFMFEFNQMGEKWIRMNFTADGGGSSGAINCGVHGKAV